MSVNAVVTSLSELANEKNKLIVLAPTKKGDGYRVQFEGPYDTIKAMKTVQHKEFFPYYETGVKEVPLGLTNKFGTSAALRGNILEDNKMLAAGFDVSPLFRKKRNNAKEYFCYKRLIYPGVADPDLSLLVKVSKDSQDVDVKILNADGAVYDYRDIFNTSKGENKVAAMTMMQVEFWITYFQDREILNGHNFGDFVC